MMGMRHARSRERSRARRLVAHASALLVALILGSALAMGPALSSLGLAPTPVARACGLGAGPTMLANSTPALLYPVTTNTNQPVGIFAPDYTMGQAITFTEDLSRVPGAPAPNTLKWRWKFGDGTETTGEIASKHMFAKPGTYDVYAQIFDTSSNIWTDLDSAQIHVIAALPANPPVARATATAQVVQSGGNVTFDASGSSSPIGSPLSYLWNFGDGFTDTHARVTHQFVIQNGKGFVSLVVTDARGARGVATLNIVVPQIILFANPSHANAGASVAFDATDYAAQNAQSGGQAGGGPSGYTWDFGDGTPTQTTAQPTISHTYKAAGTYVATAQVSDSEGGGPLEAVTVVIAAPPNPLLLFGGSALALLALLAIGAFAFRAYQRRRALEEQRRMALELARARRVGPARPRGQAPRPPRGHRDDPPGGYPPPGQRRSDPR